MLEKETVLKILGRKGINSHDWVLTILWEIFQKLKASEYTYLGPTISLDNLPLKDATIY